MRVQPIQNGPLHALNSVLTSIESVRNAPALYLLLLSFTVSGWLVSQAQASLGAQSVWSTAVLAGAAFFIVFYGSNAAGLILMDEARGHAGRDPLDAVRDALRCAHRVLLVVGVVLLLVAALVALVLVGLQASRWPALGPGVLAVLVPVAVIPLGVAVLAMVLLVGPLAAPAVWFGLAPGQVLRLLWRQARERFAHAVMLGAAVSLLSAAVAALVSFVVLAGGRLLLGLALLVVEVDLAPQPFLAALFGQVWRVAPGAPALPPATASAITGAGVVFALGLVLPAVVYLRGLCELFLALYALDNPPPGTPESTPQTPV